MKDAAHVSASVVRAVALPAYSVDWPAVEHAWNAVELIQKDWQNKLLRKIDSVHSAHHFRFFTSFSLFNKDKGSLL